MLFSLRQIGWVARIAWLEARRQGLLQLLLLAAALLVLGTRQLREFNFGSSERRFVFDLGSGILFGFGSVLSAATIALLFFGENGARETMTWRAKPMGRAEFLAGRYLGALAVITGFSLLMTGLLAAILAVCQKTGTEGAIDAGEGWADLRRFEVAVSGFLHWLQFAVLAALTLLVASFARSAASTVVISLAAWTAGHLQLWLHGSAPSAPPDIIASLTGFAAWIVPDLRGLGMAAFAPGNDRLRLDAMAWPAASALLHIVGFGLLAFFGFNRRES